MLELSGINIWAVIVTWLIYIVVGAFWYSPIGFSRLWAEYTGIDIMKLPKHESTRILVAVIISSLIQAVTLAIVFNSFNISTARDGHMLVLLLWLGLVTASTVGVTLYQRRSWKFLVLNSSYFLVVMTLGSLVLSTWK